MTSETPLSTNEARDRIHSRSSVLAVAMKAVRTWERTHGALTTAEVAVADQTLNQAGVRRTR